MLKTIFKKINSILHTIHYCTLEIVNIVIVSVEIVSSLIKRKNRTLLSPVSVQQIAVFGYFWGTVNLTLCISVVCAVTADDCDASPQHWEDQ